MYANKQSAVETIYSIHKRAETYDKCVKICLSMPRHVVQRTKRAKTVQKGVETCKTMVDCKRNV